MIEDNMQNIERRINTMENNISIIQDDLSAIRTDNAVIKNNIEHILEKLNSLNCKPHTERIEEVAEETEKSIVVLDKSISNIKTVWATVYAGTVLISIIIGIVEYMRGGLH